MMDTMHQVRIANLPAWVDWVQAAVIILGGIVAISTLVLYYFEYRKGREEFKKAGERQRAEKAVEIAKHFAKAILPQIFEMHDLIAADLFRRKAWEKIITKLNLVFDRDEAYGLVGAEELQEIASDYRDPKNEQKYDKISDLLNQLEAISIEFNKNIADEETVYQSLHGVFILTMQQLYLDIALNNAGVRQGPEKLYTGCVELYKKWRKRQYERTRAWETDIAMKNAEHENVRRKGILKTPPLT